MKPLGKEWVMKQLKTPSAQKTTGPDKVSAIFLKDGAESLAPSLKHIIYLSIKTPKG